MKIIFVHGAFVRDGSWWWAPVAENLAKDGFKSESIALPSCGESETPLGASGPGLVEDAAALTKGIDSDDDVIVVASSYGGTVVAEGANQPNVRHLVYISSFLPEIGQTHADVVGTSSEPLPMAANADGSLSVVDEGAGFDARFLHDVTDENLILGAHERLTAQSPAALMTPTTAAAWQEIQSTYFVCAQDRNTDPALQRTHAARATHAIELATGHHPFLSRPELVADHLRKIAQDL